MAVLRATSKDDEVRKMPHMERYLSLVLDEGPGTTMGRREDGRTKGHPPKPESRINVSPESPGPSEDIALGIVERHRFKRVVTRKK